MRGRPGARRLAARRALLAGLAVLGALSPAAAGRASEGKPTGLGDWACQDGVCQRVTRRGEALSFELRSRSARTVWVELEPRGLVNVRALGRPPFLVRLAPGETRLAGRLMIEQPGEPHGYGTQWRVLPGNPHAVHDDRWHYRMPFGGSRPVAISQGYEGPFSHRGASTYALDFPMPRGTPILAARGGTIVEVVDDQVARGLGRGDDERDNRVVVEHADGTFSVYAHLEPGGPARVGQRVRSGELIGRSGETGFATGPHLHFEVYRIRENGKRQSIPVRFWDGTTAGFTPKVDVAYAPGCPRSGAESCRPGELADEP